LFYLFVFILSNVLLYPSSISFPTSLALSPTFSADSSTLEAALLIPSFTSSAALLTPAFKLSQEFLASSRTFIAASSAFLSPFLIASRSEERRVGKECSSRWWLCE